MEDNFSKRKTYTEISILPTRLFQYNAHGGYIPNPDKTFELFTPLLGRQFDSLEYREHIKTFQLSYLEHPHDSDE